jgi:hypothetical protein
VFPHVGKYSSLDVSPDVGSVQNNWWDTIYHQPNIWISRHSNFESAKLAIHASRAPTPLHPPFLSHDSGEFLQTLS